MYRGDKVAIGAHHAKRGLPVERQPGHRRRRAGVAGAKDHVEVGGWRREQAFVGGAIASHAAREVDVGGDQAP